jgi:DNA-binding response OmpR family regulator
MNFSDPITVLSVATSDEDHAWLSELVSTRQWWPSGSESNWQLETCASLVGALPILKNHSVSVVICEQDLGAASWRELLTELSALPDPPCLIVTSRTADEYLWAEALNLGAFDVLAKPFEPREVTRVLSSAWFHRRHRKGTSPRAPKVRAALAS